MENQVAMNTENIKELQHYVKQLLDRIDGLERAFNEEKGILLDQITELKSNLETESDFLSLARDDIAELKERVDKEKKAFFDLIEIKQEDSQLEKNLAHFREEYIPRMKDEVKKFYNNFESDEDIILYWSNVYFSKLFG